ncbi:MAG: acyltransferase [Bifidobacteriaceae bacterium]|jgi:peptidoglycan/LPS O-acetylase OafA/YrhL|nr:acyltransferase [Bifidobacteriaceae bacterium]
MKKRITSIDGVRGVACFMVMFYHTNKNTIYNTSDLWTSSTSQNHEIWLNFTNFFFGAHTGSEAVTVFLAISGFVAAYGLCGISKYSWVSYTVRRIGRLLIPCFAVLLILIATQTISNHFFGVSLHQDWTQRSLTDYYYWGSLFSSFDFIFGVPFALYPPMWTIKWILYFSLLLPAVFAAMLKFEDFLSKNIIAVYVICCGLSCLGFMCDLDTLKFLPPFALGVNLAMFYYKHPDRKDLKLSNNLFLWFLLIAGLVLIKIPDYYFAWQHYTGQNYMGFWTIASLPILYAVLYLKPLDRFLSTKPLQWLGKISFALFITHWAIVANSTFENWVVGFSTPSLPFSPWLIVILCLLIAWLFWKFVEKPSAKLSSLMGQVSANLVTKYFQANQTTKN